MRGDCSWCRITGRCLSPRGSACAAAERPLRLLWVEDDPCLARTLGRGLTRFAEIVRARMVVGSEEALVQARSYRPDLVALDVDMPGMDGLELCRQLKACEETRGARVVFVTGSAREDLEAEAEAAGAERVLRKPTRILEVLRGFEAASSSRERERPRVD